MKPKGLARTLSFVTLLTLPLGVAGSACGPIHLGSGSGYVNEPVPANATLLVQGNISSVGAGVTLSGVAQVYQDASGNAVVRLSGFSTSATTLYLFLETSTSNQFHIARVRATSGNQNYSTGLSTAGVTFTGLMFRVTASVSDPLVGSATLL